MQGCKAMYSAEQFHPIAIDALTHDARNDELKTLLTHDCGEDWLEAKTAQPLPAALADLAIRSNNAETATIAGTTYERTILKFNAMSPWDVILHRLTPEGKRDTTTAILLRDPTRQKINDRHTQWTLSLRWTGQQCEKYRPVAAECFRDAFVDLFHGQIDQSDIVMQRVDYCINIVTNRPIRNADYGFNPYIHHQHHDNMTNVSTQLTLADPRGSWGGSSTDSHTKYLAGLRIRIYDSGEKDRARCGHPSIPPTLRSVLSMAYDDPINKPHCPNKLQTTLALIRIESQMTQSWLRHFDCHRLSDYLRDRGSIAASAFSRFRIVRRNEDNKSRCEDAEWWAQAMAGIRTHQPLQRIPRRSKLRDRSQINRRLANILAERAAIDFALTKEPPPKTLDEAIRRLTSDDRDEIEYHIQQACINRLHRDRNTEIAILEMVNRLEPYIPTEETFYETRPSPDEYQAAIDHIAKTLIIPSSCISNTRVTDVCLDDDFYGLPPDFDDPPPRYDALWGSKTMHPPPW